MDPHLDFLFFIITENQLIQPTVRVDDIFRHNRHSGGDGDCLFIKRRWESTCLMAYLYNGCANQYFDAMRESSPPRRARRAEPPSRARRVFL